MTTIKKTVQEIIYGVEVKGKNYLNKVVFTDTYSAMEVTNDPSRSNFSVATEVEFVITHPGFNGKPDWIEARNTENAPMYTRQEVVTAFAGVAPLVNWGASAEDIKNELAIYAKIVLEGARDFNSN